MVSKEIKAFKGAYPHIVFAISGLKNASGRSIIAEREDN
jgi:hypothetical protein